MPWDPNLVRRVEEFQRIGRRPGVSYVSGWFASLFKVLSWIAVVVIVIGIVNSFFNSFSDGMGLALGGVGVLIVSLASIWVFRGFCSIGLYATETDILIVWPVYFTSVIPLSEIEEVRVGHLFGANRWIIIRQLHRTRAKRVPASFLSPIAMMRRSEAVVIADEVMRLVNSQSQEG